MNYATDGKCHNAEPGTWGHECSKPATWIGMTSTGFLSGFCVHCKQRGHEAKSVVEWAVFKSEDASDRTMLDGTPLALGDTGFVC